MALKIAFLVHDYHRAGGHSRYVAELATRFARHHDVHVFANSFPSGGEGGITFHHVPASRANALALIFTFRRNATRLLRGGRWDIVHDQGLCCARPDVITAHICQRAWSLARRNAPWNERLFGSLISAAESLQYRSAASREIIAVSARLRDDLRRHYGFRDHATIIHHGVDADLFGNPEDREVTRRELGVAPAEPLFLFAGDFRKGVDTAIRALEQGRLLCVGSTAPDRYRALAHSLGRGDRVSFFPQTDRIERLFAAADTLLLPTPYDAFGMVVLEGMAAGLPVIVSREAGASELVHHGHNGLILQDPHNPTELNALMERALASPTLGEHARATARERSWDVVADATLDVYRRALAKPRVLAFATAGAGSQDEARLRILLECTPAEFFPFDRAGKSRSGRHIFRRLATRRYSLAVMEGTGIAGGAALLAARVLGIHYVVSSGDAVGPFIAAQEPLLGWVFGIYEWLLCRASSGFIGWTPYLAGRALTFGAPRAMTAPGWAASRSEGKETEIRQRLGIPKTSVGVGIAGSLAWNRRVGYCYGYELVRALAHTKRPDLAIVIIGDGPGLAHLRQMSDPRVFFTGAVPRDQVLDYLAGLDAASLPQSCDGVGSFRYTTKLADYLAAGLPVITGQIPLAYDLDTTEHEGGSWLWRLPGDAPWTETYIRALAALLDRVTPEDLAARRASVPTRLPLFDRERQAARATAFLRDILDSL